MKDNIEIYTDGSSLGNPGPGGWGVVVINNYQLPINNERVKEKGLINNKQKEESKKDGNSKIIKELGGAEKNTTNNRMELQAVIESLKYIALNKDMMKMGVTIYTDSNYVLSGITSWVYNWEKNGWRTANRKEVLNQDLWRELILLSRNINIKINWQKVKGHSGHIYNDRADDIATSSAMREQKYIL